jgi:hypothetical protein
MKNTRRPTAIIEREQDAYAALPELEIAGHTVESARKNRVGSAGALLRVRCCY